MRRIATTGPVPAIGRPGAWGAPIYSSAVSQRDEGALGTASAAPSGRPRSA